MYGLHVKFNWDALEILIFRQVRSQTLMDRVHSEPNDYHVRDW